LPTDQNGNAGRLYPDLAVVNNWLRSKRRRHTFNIGGELRRGFENQQSCTSCAGNFGFSANQTSVPNTSDPNFGKDGSSFASFLLGLSSDASRSYAPEVRSAMRVFRPTSRTTSERRQS
jgi:hypothetical protein